MIRVPRPLLAAALFVATAMGLPSTAARADGGLRFDAAVTALRRCDRTCFEPTVAVDRRGWIFVTDGSGAGIGVSRDGGVTFESEPAPPWLPRYAESARADAMVQVAPNGRLYYSALVFGPDVLATAGRGKGLSLTTTSIQVAWSADGGRTWPSNVLVEPPGSTGLDVNPDRQWLAFGPGVTVYLSYNQIPLGILVLRSDDGGATFNHTGVAAFTPLRADIGQSGAPVVDRRGRVLVPYLDQRPGVGGVALAVSDDGGATFTEEVAWTAPPGVLAAGGGFPIVALGPDDAPSLVWWDGLRTMVVSRRGGTWTAPVVWGDERGGEWSCPWIAVTPSGDTDVLSYSPATPARNTTVMFARGRGRPAAIVELSRVALVGDNGCNTDFGHFVLTPDGCAVVTWASVWGVQVARQRCR